MFKKIIRIGVFCFFVCLIFNRIGFAAGEFRLVDGRGALEALETVRTGLIGSPFKKPLNTVSELPADQLVANHFSRFSPSVQLFLLYSCSPAYLQDLIQRTPSSVPMANDERAAWQAAETMTTVNPFALIQPTTEVIESSYRSVTDPSVRRQLSFFWIQALHQAIGFFGKFVEHPDGRRHFVFDPKAPLPFHAKRFLRALDFLEAETAHFPWTPQGTDDHEFLARKSRLVEAFSDLRTFAESLRDTQVRGAAPRALLTPLSLGESLVEIPIGTTLVFRFSPEMSSSSMEFRGGENMAGGGRRRRELLDFGVPYAHLSGHGAIRVTSGEALEYRVVSANRRWRYSIPKDSEFGKRLLATAEGKKLTVLHGLNLLVWESYDAGTSGPKKFNSGFPSSIRERPSEYLNLDETTLTLRPLRRDHEEVMLHVGVSTQDAYAYLKPEQIGEPTLGMLMVAMGKYLTLPGVDSRLLRNPTWLDGVIFGSPGLR